MQVPTIELNQVKLNAPITEGSRKYLLEPFKDNNYILPLDYSSLSQFMECDTKFLYSNIYGRIATGKSSALTYGSAIHKGLEHYYRGEPLEACLNAGQQEFLLNPPSILEWRNADHFTNTLTKYIEKYSKEDTFTILEHDNHKMIECPFREPLGTFPINALIPLPKSLLVKDAPDVPFYIENIHVIWTGVIDLIVEEAGRLYIVDHKTTSIEGDAYWKSFELSPQFMGYVWAASRLLNKPIDGALANVIYGREPAKTEATRREHEKKRFMRRYYLYREDQIQDWPKQISRLISDLVHSITTDSFAMRFTQCVQKFGPCPYHDVCSLPSSQRNTMLHSDQYTNNVWNPLA